MNRTASRWLPLVVLSSLLPLYQNCGKSFEVQPSNILSQNSVEESLPPVASKTQKVNLLLASGSADTVSISCDGGESWPYHKYDPVFDTMSDSDLGHSEHSVNSVQYSEGYFYKLKGWGVPSKLLRSSDGIKWEDVFQYTDMLSGMVVHKDSIIAADRGNFWQSSNGGKSFQLANIDAGSRHLNTFKFERNGTHFIAFGDGAMALSHDLGKNWQRKNLMDGTAFPCGHNFAYGNDKLLALGMNGEVCRSMDSGESWTRTATLTGFFSNQKLVWTGTRFIAYVGNNTTAYESADGISWTPVQLQGLYPFNETIVFKNPANNGFYAYYTRGQFLKSPDGITWTKLADSKQAAGTGAGINSISIGEVSIEPGHPCYVTPPKL